MMSEKVDLKELERKAYTSYHQDGLIDLFGILFLAEDQTGARTAQGLMGG